MAYVTPSTVPFATVGAFHSGQFASVSMKLIDPYIVRRDGAFFIFVKVILFFSRVRSV